MLDHVRIVEGHRDNGATLYTVTIHHNGTIQTTLYNDGILTNEQALGLAAGLIRAANINTQIADRFTQYHQEQAKLTHAAEDDIIDLVIESQNHLPTLTPDTEPWHGKATTND